MWWFIWKILSLWLWAALFWEWNTEKPANPLLLVTNLMWSVNQALSQSWLLDNCPLKSCFQERLKMVWRWQVFLRRMLHAPLFFESGFLRSNRITHVMSDRRTYLSTTVTLGYIDAARRFVLESEIRWRGGGLPIKLQNFFSTEFCFPTMY